ncbi:MAG: hypothetical protein M0Z53_14120 [Thermaerobacter sp.]|nr:hypothetical protein [Thermaerobacter sp.]
MVTIILLSVASGLLVHAWMTDSADWWPGAAWALSIPARNPWLMLSALLAGWGLGLVQKAAIFERQRDRDEQQAELTLRQLARLLPQRGSLALALEDLGYSSVVRARDAEGMLANLADQWRIEAFTVVGQVAHRAKQHGGALEPVIKQAISKIARDRRRRFQRHLDEAAKRATIQILAFAPYGILVMFAGVIPSFYHSLMSTALGHAVVLGVGLVTVLAMGALAVQIRKRAESR